MIRNTGVGETSFPLSVATSGGQQCLGRLVLAERWRAELGGQELALGEEFRIVILAQGPSETPKVTRQGVVVCVPEAPITGAKAFREARSTYDVGLVKPPAFSRAALTALARGGIFSLAPLEVQPRQIFRPVEGGVAWDLLATALVAQWQQKQASGEAQPYLQTLAAALRLPIPARPDAQAIASTLAALRQAIASEGEVAASLVPLPEELPSPAEVIARLERLAASEDGIAFLAAVRESYREPLALAEDAFFCRALSRDSAATMEMARMRWFVAKAEVPPSLHELFTDRAAQREDLTFSVVADQLHNFPGVRSRFQLFRLRYQRAYLAHHQRYWHDSAQLHLELQEAASKVAALQRLNTLRELGPPLDEMIGARQMELLAATAGCPLEPGLEAALREAPLCAVCNITLGDEPARRKAQELFQELDRALSQQLQRLSGQAVAHILTRSGEGRLDRFLKVVQASDLAGLANVLNDRLLEFLRQLLVEAKVRVPLSPLLAELGQSYPEVGEEELEAVTQEMARLLRQALQAARQSSSP